MSKYRCTVCGYIHEGDSAPEKCPVCAAPASAFVLVESDRPAKKKFLGGKNNNTYIIVYSTVMVVVVALLLSITALKLKPLQNANVLNEKKSAIMQALADQGSYDQNIEAYTVDQNGAKIESVTPDQTLNMLFGLREAFAAGQYPVFEDKANGEYVVPVMGKGLWGDIWGYVALKGDMNTISGVVFSHKSETPGLGAEIATPKFWAQFPGKTIFNNGELVSISVVKGGADANDPHGVDAISGGTKTSVGLQNMLKDCLEYYAPFFASKAAGSEAVIEVEEPAEEVSNEENVESNE